MMKNILIEYTVSASLVSILLAGIPFSTDARYADDFDGHYDDLHCAEDDCDCLEPDNNRFKVVSPSALHNAGDTVVFTGAYDQVQEFFETAGQTDGLPIVPPTPLKVEKFMRYTPCSTNGVIATLNGREVTAYQVAVNAVMSGCSADLLPVCIAMVKAMDDDGYLQEISDGSRVPLAFVNGPVGRQVGVDNEQGMTTEEVNVCLGRFIEFALINLAGVAHNRSASFGSVQPLVFSENDEACLAVGWQPYHVQQGYGLNDSTVTMTSFSMWGNNSTPATDWPEEIMKLVAWDVTEKNLGGLGSADSETYAETKRTILITPPVALALSALYRSKEALAGDLAFNARRPMALRAFAYYYADTDGVLSSGKTFAEVYDKLVAKEEEGARITSAPAWLNGITNPKVMTGAALKTGNTRILVTGDASRNKTQVMPGGKSITVGIELPDGWDALLVGLQHKVLSSFELHESDDVVKAPINVPSLLTAGTYRILDPATGDRYLTRAGRLYLDPTSNTLYAYPVGGVQTASMVLDTDVYADFIKYIGNLGYNSSFTVSAGAATNAVIRFASNASKLENNTVALTQEAFAGKLTLHANNTPNSNAAGGVALSGSIVKLSASVTSFDVNLDGNQLVVGETSAPGFITLRGAAVTVDTDVPAGTRTVIGSPNGDDTYRTLTFTMRANGTYDIAYHAYDTLSLADSTVELRWTANGETTVEAFAKTDVPGVYTLTKHCLDGEHRFNVSIAGVSYGSATAITNSCDRLQLSDETGECTLKLADSDYYTFKFDSRDNKLTVAKDVTKAGLCSGGTIENIAGVYVIRPNAEVQSVMLADLTADPMFAVAINDVIIPGQAFEGLAEGNVEGAFSLALKPPVVENVQVGVGADGVSVSVETFENLRYMLKRSGTPGGEFVPVNAAGAEAIGTGKSIRLIDTSLDRPADKAFYRIGVSIPAHNSPK
jgi:hypothetical protein